MAWGWLQSFAGRNLTGIGATATATPGSNLTSGSTLIAIVGISNASSTTATSVQDAAANNFLEIKTSGYVNAQETSLWALNTPAGDAGTKPVITATCSAANGAIIALLVVEFSGIVTGATLAALVDGTPTVKSASTNTATGSSGYSSTLSNELLVMGYADDGGPLTWVLPSGATNDNNGGTANGWNTDSNIDVELSFKNSTGGSETDSWGLSGTATGWSIVAAAFKLAGGAAPRPALPLQGAIQPPQPARPPRGQIVAFTAAAFLSGATLSGSGTLTAVYTVAGGGSPVVIQAVPQAPQPPQPPPGQITGAAPLITFTVGATLSGQGTLTAGPGVGGFPVVIQAPLPQPLQPPLPPPGRLLTGPVTLPGAAALSGSGTLAAAPFFSAAAVLSGSGTLTAGPGTGGLPLLIQAPLLQPAQPPAPPAARVLTAPSAALLASATLTGSGSLAALPFFSAAATLSGQGTLTAAYTVAGAAPYVITAVIQPAQPAQPPPGRLLGVPPPPPPPVLQSATIAATVSEGTTTTATVADQATITASVT